jgi:carboxyl-terminal processing protease
MSAWARLCRVGTRAAITLLLLGATLSLATAADEPLKSSKPNSSKQTVQTVNQLRTAADAAEKAGDWDAAFTAYCHLIVADRNAADVREKLNIALRRSQQLRRHRDPQFQQFATTTSVSDALNLFAEVISKVPALYAERDRCTPQVLWQNGIEELSRALLDPTFRQVFLDPSHGDKPPAKLENFRKSLSIVAKQQIDDARIARTALRKLLNTAQDAFSIRIPSALVLEMVCGACGGLDEYTIFLSPSQQNTESQSALPDLSAYGIYLSFTDGEVMVSGIVQGSWAAYHSSLRKGDKIARINGRSMDGATPLIAAQALRMAVDGSRHMLDIADVGSDEMGASVSLPVPVPTVYAPSVKDFVGYARIGSFSPDTARELDNTINLLKMRSGIRAMILDLRGNMGGSFLASVETAKRLIPNGLIVTTQGQLAEVSNQPFSSDSGMSAHDLPIVVLIDAETASAAEVLAAALKDNERATLIGMPTFGKGAIQYPLKLVSLDDTDDQGKPRINRSGTVRLTIAKLIAPKSGAINGVGISPQILEANPVRQLELAQEKAVELITSPPRPSVPSMPDNNQ